MNEYQLSLQMLKSAELGFVYFVGVSFKLESVSPDVGIENSRV
jgi:hypothetical protein